MSTSRAGGAPARRALLRWSWRMFVREWRQQLLVLALVVVSVAIAVAGSSMAMNAAAASQHGFGTASAMSRLQPQNPEQAATLVDAARTRFGDVEVISHQPLRIPGSAEPLDLRAQDPAGRFGHTMLSLLEGDDPTEAGEVALTPGAADLLGVEVGDTVDLGGSTRAVVGIVENPTELGDEFALAAPGSIAAPASLTLLFERPRTDGASAGSSEATPGTGAGLADVPVIVRGDDGPVGALVLVAVALAMGLVGLIAASGFVVVAQRRQRQLGLLAAIGATERHLRLVVVANGAIVGAVAAVAGTALGILGWMLAAPAVERAAGRRIDRFDLAWGIVIGCAAIAAGVSTAAAWWPARRMSRTPIVAALSGRPPRPAPVHRSLLVAFVLLVAGVAAIAVAVAPDGEVRPLLLIGGVVAVAIGTVFGAPAAIRVGAAPAARMRLPGRLALRDLARYQGRASAALAAITFVVGISVTVVSIAGANRYRSDEGNLSDRQVLVTIDGVQPTTPSGATAAQIAALDAKAATVAGTIDGARTFPLDVAHRAEQSDDPMLQEPISLARAVGDSTWNNLGFPSIATPELLARYGIDPASIRPDTELLAADTHNVILLDIAQRNPQATKVQHVDLPTYSSGPKALITEHAMEEHGWTRERTGWLIESPRALTTEQIASARTAAADAGMAIEVRSSQDGLASLRLIATGVGALLALAIVAMTVGLIRSESARDLRTLTATGADRRVRRALTACTAGALATMGVVLGGIGAHLALVAGYHADLSRLTPVPWAPLITIAIGLPMLAFGAGWVLAGREPTTCARGTFD